MTVYKPPFGLPVASGWWFRAGGARHLALLISFGSDDEESATGVIPDPAALAVFRLRRRTTRGGDSLYDFELVEAVDPQTDRFTSFPEALPLIDENAKNQFFWIVNTHFNAGENFAAYETVRIDGNGRLRAAIEKMPGSYVSMDCSDNTADFLTVKRRERAAGNVLPYDFSLRTLFIEEHECRRESKRKKAIAETKIYRARRSVSKRGKRSVWRLVLIARSKRTVSVLRDQDY
jgi:hypothetical protein